MKAGTAAFAASLAVLVAVTALAIWPHAGASTEPSRARACWTAIGPPATWTTPASDTHSAPTTSAVTS